MRLTDDNLRGRIIISADGRVVGEVTALFLDSEVWQVESLQVKLGNDVADHLGVNHSMFHTGALEIPVRMVQSVGETIVLTVPVNALREMLPKHVEEETDGAAAHQEAHVATLRA